MNVTDQLALARFCAWRMLDHTEPGWETLPRLSEADYNVIVAQVQLIAWLLYEWAGERGRQLYEAAS